MTEQPSPSAEALKLGGYASSYEMVMKLAVEIDALCEQRVSAETERCAQIVAYQMSRNFNRSAPGSYMWLCDAIRAPAERPVPPPPPAVVDYTERTRLFANQTYTGPDSYARYRKALADEFAAVASDHQAALLARLGEPEMREAVRESMMCLYGWKPETGHLNTEAADEMADAALAVITEKLNG